MKKRTKILSILLALMLTATLVPTALVQVFASDYEWEDSATADEPEEGITITSFEITKLNVASYYKDFPVSWEITEGIEVLITFSDGTSYEGAYFDEAFNEALEEKGLYDDFDSAIHITTDLDSLPIGKNAVTFEFCGFTDTKEITVEQNDPRAIVKIELTKLPDKAFTAPYFTGERPDNSDFEAFNSFFENLDDNNSIAYNMNGAELTAYLASGEQKVIYRFSEHTPAMSLYGQSVYPDCGILSVTDLGNYKARIRYEDFHYAPEDDFVTEFTVSNTGDTPATPGEVINPTTPSNPSSTVPTSSGNGTSSTSDTPENSKTSSSNTSNGAVATGNVAVSAILLSVLLSAAGVMAVIGRKKRLF